MRKKRNDPKWVDDPGVAERAIVLQVLRDDHHERWTRKELKREIYDIKGRTINKALKRLQEGGVCGPRRGVCVVVPVRPVSGRVGHGLDMSDPDPAGTEPVIAVEQH